MHRSSLTGWRSATVKIDSRSPTTTTLAGGRPRPSMLQVGAFLAKTSRTHQGSPVGVVPGKLL